MSAEDVALSEDTLSAVRTQVEYYFSKENLQSDAFLNSLMDSQNSVPLAAVMKFAKLKSLTQDEETVIQALHASTLVTFIDGRIRTNAKTGRFTIILRDIPSDAPEEEIREIFAYENCKPITSVRSELGDNWFVTMETEDDAKDTLLDLRVKKRTFRGQAVKGRLKSEPLVRSFYPIQPVSSMPPVPSFNGFMPPAVQMMPMSMGMYGFGLPNPVDLGMNMGIPMEGQISSGYINESNEVVEEVVKDLINASVSNMRNNTPTGSVSGRSANGSGKSRPQKTANTSNGVTGGKKQVAKPTPPERRVIDNSPLHFPPLVSHEEGAPPTPGYKGAFVKYTADELVAIVEHIKEATLPDGILPTAHAIAMEETANTNLLLRQRTFSIDETRELLRQGRPVQREAVLGGSVDLHSLMFGEPDAHVLEEGSSRKPGGSWAAMAARAVGDVSASASANVNGAKTVKSTPKVKVDRVDKSLVEKQRSPRSERGKPEDEERPKERKEGKEGKEGRRKESKVRSSVPSKEEEEVEAVQPVVEQQEGSAMAVVADTKVVEKATTKSSSWGGRPTFANILKQQQEPAKPNASLTPVASVSIQLEGKEELSSETTPTDTALTEGKSRDGMSGDVWTKEHLLSVQPKKHNVERANKKIDS